MPSGAPAMQLNRTKQDQGSSANNSRGSVAEASCAQDGPHLAFPGHETKCSLTPGTGSFSDPCKRHRVGITAVVDVISLGAAQPDSVSTLAVKELLYTGCSFEKARSTCMR